MCVSCPFHHVDADGNNVPQQKCQHHGASMHISPVVVYLSTWWSPCMSMNGFSTPSGSSTTPLMMSMFSAGRFMQLSVRSTSELPHGHRLEVVPEVDAPFDRAQLIQLPPHHIQQSACDPLLGEGAVAPYITKTE